MRTWMRAAQQTLCGGPCHRFIAKGQPMLELRAASWAKGKYRCQDCAGEVMPANIPQLPEPRTIAPTTSTGLAPLPFASFQTPADFKMAAGGGREPGEEG